MAARVPRRLARLAIVGLLAVQGLAASPASVSAAAASFDLDLASRGDFVAQTNFVQCVGASMQMMLNMIEPTDDRTASRQLELQVLARSLSGPRRDGNERQGASVRGWTAGLNLLGAGHYRLTGTDSLDEALRLAADAIRQTGRPVGLLVWRGRHAWVMSGFRATADPALTDDFKVTAAIVMDPLYPHGSSVWGPSPKPREALSVSALGRQFVPRRSSSFAGSLGGKYVMVLPYEPVTYVRMTRLIA